MNWQRSSDASRKPGPRASIGVWLAVFALLLQSALPMSGMPLMSGVTGLSGDTPAICDARATTEGKPAATGGKRDDGKRQPCPICQVLQQFGTYLPPAETKAVTLAWTVVAGETPATSFLPPNRIISSCRVRAPPLAA